MERGFDGEIEMTKIISWKLTGYDRNNDEINLSDIPNDIAQQIDEWITEEIEKPEDEDE